MTDPATLQRISECSKALAIACVKAMTMEGKVDLPAMVAGCARMSGSYLLRSFKLDLSATAPGETVLSVQAGEKTQQLLRFCASMLKTLGTGIAESPPSSLDEIRGSLKPDFLESQKTLEPVFSPLQHQYSLDDEQMAKAAAVATGALIHQAAKHMDPNVGFGYAAFGFTEGARTVPLKLSSNSPAT